VCDSDNLECSARIKIQRSMGTLPTSVSNRLFRDRNRVLQKLFWVKYPLLYCRQRIEEILLLGVFLGIQVQLF